MLCTEYQCCSKVHCEVSLVADALRITVCAREKYMVATGDIEFMHHSNQKEKVYSEL